MSELSMQRVQKGMPPISVDACVPCQSIWFDMGESNMISPSAIGSLVGLFGKDRDSPASSGAPAAIAPCPSCKTRLVKTRDQTRHGPITYLSCPGCRGRAVSLSHFLVEKGFVRHLPPAAVRAVGAAIGMVKCQGCGAPVDLRTQDRCQFCQSPIAVLDPRAVSKAMAEMAKRQASVDSAPEPSAIAGAIVQNAKAALRSSVSLGGREARAVLASAYDTESVDDLISDSMSLLLGLHRRAP